jgi:hypothetical protein
MKFGLILTILFTVTSAWAYAPNFPGLTFPEESGWSKHMTRKICDIRTLRSDKGVSEDAATGGVIYTVYNSKGQVKAQAWASSDSRWPKHSRCLLK